MAASVSWNAKQKKKHIKAVTPKLRLFRAKEPLMSVFMWGINHSINELSHVNIPVMLMHDDFKAHSKIRIDNHQFNKDNMPSHYKFKEYCPIVFRNLRERFNIDEEIYVNSLTKASPLDAESPGRSGARFLMSYDQRFVIKTMVSEEIAEMHRILKDYHQHIVECHANTLLPQYLGMYRITVNDQETYMGVMRNVFSPRLIVHKKYDLKGSTVSRHASDKEKQKDLPTFKDNDFVKDGITLYIGIDAKNKLMDTLKADVDFLAKLNLMDYSLLVGIHDVDRAEQEAQEEAEQAEAAAEDSPEENGVEEDRGAGGADEDEGAVDLSTPNVSMVCPTPPDSPVLPSHPPMFSGSFDPYLELFAIKSEPSSGRSEIYFMALIDILTHYGVKKRSAAAAKTVKYGANAEISTVKPEQYARRFLEFVIRVLQ